MESTDDGVKKVTFAFPTADTDLTETARLLENFSQQPPETSLPSTKATVLVAPPQLVATTTLAKPENMSIAPESVDEWPKDSLRLPCTHCGHYVETMPNEETGGICYLAQRCLLSTSHCARLQHPCKIAGMHFIHACRDKDFISEYAPISHAEYMGCKACFTGNPVFRRSFVH